MIGYFFFKPGCSPCTNTYIGKCLSHLGMNSQKPKKQMLSSHLLFCSSQPRMVPRPKNRYIQLSCFARKAFKFARSKACSPEIPILYFVGTARRVEEGGSRKDTRFDAMVLSSRADRAHFCPNQLNLSLLQMFLIAEFEMKT